MSSITLKKEYPDGYSNDAIEILKLISFSEGKKINIVGTMSLRSQIYAGDYDINERVNTHGNKQDALKSLTRKFKSMIRNIERTPLTYVSDIKSGSIEEWRIIFNPYNHRKSQERLHELYEKKIIDKKMFLEGKKRIVASPSKLELLLLEDDFRPNIIRWKPVDVLKGYKYLQDGRKFTLEEAFETPTITKLDVISWVQNNRFTDFAIIYEFRHNGKTLNPSLRDFEQAIRENIFVLYHQKKFYKMAKRIFALARAHENDELIELLSPLFNGDLGRLYIVYGDIGTIESLFESSVSIPYSKLEFEFDQFKTRLSNISLPKYIKQEDTLFKMIDTLVSMDKSSSTKGKVLELLGEMKERLLDLLSNYTALYMKKHKIFPNY
jgi:hypothetical protein